MFGQVGEVAERFVANRALVGLGAGVRVEVHPQLRLRHETLVTVRADVRLLIVVRLHVIQEATSLIEDLSAYFAHEYEGFEVLHYMVHERAPVGVVPAADGTAVQRLLVHLQVLLAGGQRREAHAAAPAPSLLRFVVVLVDDQLLHCCKSVSI